MKDTPFTKMPTQTEAGKAFEYALVKKTYELLSPCHSVELKEDSSLQVARNCFDLFGAKDQDKYLRAAITASLHIIEIEPRLNNPYSPDDTLTLQIAPDSEGIKGDVRDVLLLRSAQSWEIGISAKNNHKAVKHSRLSDKIDFGKEWLGLPCSDAYYSNVLPVFQELRQLKEKEELWRNLPGKHRRFYIPVLEAFKDELIRLDRENPSTVPANLLRYLIGHKDFYKIIKRSNKSEVYGFHLYGTLNKPAEKVKPTFKVPRLKLPARIIEIIIKPNSTDTIILTCDEGWQISFRIHNASSKVEPSLKFDINLIGQPPSLYTHHLNWVSHI